MLRNPACFDCCHSKGAHAGHRQRTAIQSSGYANSVQEQIDNLEGKLSCYRQNENETTKTHPIKRPMSSALPLNETKAKAVSVRPSTVIERPMGVPSLRHQSSFLYHAVRISQQPPTIFHNHPPSIAFHLAHQHHLNSRSEHKKENEKSSQPETTSDPAPAKSHNKYRKSKRKLLTQVPPNKLNATNPNSDRSWKSHIDASLASALPLSSITTCPITLLDVYPSLFSFLHNYPTLVFFSLLHPSVPFHQSYFPLVLSVLQRLFQVLGPLLTAVEETSAFSLPAVKFTLAQKLSLKHLSIEAQHPPANEKAKIAQALTLLLKQPPFFTFCSKNEEVSMEYRKLYLKMITSNTRRLDEIPSREPLVTEQLLIPTLPICTQSSSARPSRWKPEYSFTCKHARLADSIDRITSNMADSVPHVQLIQVNSVLVEVVAEFCVELLSQFPIHTFVTSSSENCGHDSRTSGSAADTVDCYLVEVIDYFHQSLLTLCSNPHALDIKPLHSPLPNQQHFLTEHARRSWMEGDLLRLDRSGKGYSIIHVLFDTHSLILDTPLTLNEKLSTEDKIVIIAGSVSNNLTLVADA
ncbi:hypothetical protein BLNAU_24159 [Blattamonas nauphoetae]|uniref:Uncharacterized protein n=1 Tax=Blattamonas nauphoetae TaxID=2049346 RepID=A0ABQ9WN98_9EUKA|nr:hypothetical protein BLNAU_24159 [Blattamonas nauphoetae]